MRGRLTGWGCGCTASNNEREGILPIHCSKLFLLPSQVQHSSADEDGICHEVSQPSLSQVPLQVRRTKGGRKGEIPVNYRAELLRFQWAHKSTGHFDKMQILIRDVWSGTQDFVLLTSLQVALMLVCNPQLPPHIG